MANEFNVSSSCCPACGEVGVEAIKAKLEFGPPSHRCPHCGVGLASKMTVRVLWAVPAAVVGVMAFFAFIHWLAGTDVNETIAAGLIGGAGAFAVSLPFQLVLRGCIFRVVDESGG